MKLQTSLIRLVNKPCLLVLSISCLIIFCNAQFEGETLRFKLSAKNLPNGDLDGPSDPYVMVFSGTRRQLDRHHRHWHYLGSTSTKVNTLNPEWDEVFQYSYINGTDQMLRFFVKDEDESWVNPIYAIDEPLGRVEFLVDQYVRKVKQLEQSRGNGTRGNETETGIPFISIKMFLSHPIGGVLLVNPVKDE